MVVGVFQMVVRGFRQNWSIFSAPLTVFTDCYSFLSLMCLLCPVKVENVRLDKSFIVGGISRKFYFSLFAFFPQVMVHFFIVFTFNTNKQLLSNYSLWCCLKLFIYLLAYMAGMLLKKNGTSLLHFLSCVSQKHVATRFDRLYIYLLPLLNYSCGSYATSNSTN